jgi:hypothetical protein
MEQQRLRLRYVVLHHDGIDRPHYDVLFETAPGSPLATWRSAEWPLRMGTPITPLPDHRHSYLDYEGPVSNNRGHVRRIASGTHEVSQDIPGLLLITALDDGTVLRLVRGSASLAQVLLPPG